MTRRARRWVSAVLWSAVLVVGPLAARPQREARRSARLADEQAALRRVATLVARGTRPEELFAAVVEEVGRLLSLDLVTMGRYESDGTMVIVGAWGRTGELFPVGTRRPLGGRNLATILFETGHSARIDDYAEKSSGPIGVAPRDAGINAAVGTPILVEGRLWGLIVAGTTVKQPLPADTEARLGGFTELVATAISNAESQAALGRLAEEQAALRRVATLVAQGAPPAELFSAVSDEVGRLFGTNSAVVRFESEGPAIVLVGVRVGKSLEGLPVGTRWELDDSMASAEVYRTGRSARVDASDWSSRSGPVTEAGQRLGVVSTVASPIIVEGRLWGAMTVSTSDQPLPQGVEERLEKFTEARSHRDPANAESRSELAASRARIMAASDDARRRIERDLHDGAQQRLVSLILDLRLAESRDPPDLVETRRALSGAAGELERTLEELQELSRGIHPAILSRGGLGPALRTLARRTAIPVVLGDVADYRLPEPIEVAAYYVVSEALANVTKHANASRVDLDASAQNGSLRLSIRDDGVGGARPTGGSGLVGLRDRVEALGGSIEITSPPGHGTHVAVQLPLTIDLTVDSPQATWRSV